MIKSPFKFLDSYTKDDREIFFGRDREIEELYQRVFESKLMLVYGVSGTGKSSLIHCGLANKFSETDWLPLVVRRGSNIINSMAGAIQTASITRQDGQLSSPVQFRKSVKSLYLDHYKPVFFIFDQFEELFIFGDREERKTFIQIIKSLIESDLQCRLIFVMREEYMAGVTEFERYIPTFFANRVRIEKMAHFNAIEAINGPCKAAGISIEEGFPEALLERLSPEGADVELTYLQVFLDKVFRLAGENFSPFRGGQGGRDSSGSAPGKTMMGGKGGVDFPGQDSQRIAFTISLLSQAGNVSDLLGSFLDEQISLLSDPDSALAVLKSFVSVKGTKRQMTSEEVKEYALTLGKPIEDSDLTEMLQTFIHLRILRDKDQNERFELRHDALATKIYEKITLVEKELIEVRSFVESAYEIYQKRKVLPRVEDLKYLAPYEDKLYLNEGIKSFIFEWKNEVERSRRTKRNWYISAGSMVIIISVFFGLGSYKKQKAAEIQARIQKSLMLSNASLSVLGEDPTLAYLLAESASQEYPTFESRKAIINAYMRGPFYRSLEGDMIHYSPSKRFLVTLGYDDNKIRIYSNNGELEGICSGHMGEIIFSSISFINNENFLMSASLEDSTIRIWDISGKEIFKTSFKGIALPDIDLTDNGRVVFSFTGSYKIFNLSGDLVDSIQHGPIITTHFRQKNKNEVILIFKNGIIELREKDSFKLKARNTLHLSGNVGSISIHESETDTNIITVSNNSFCNIWTLTSNQIHKINPLKLISLDNSFIKGDYIILQEIQSVKSLFDIWKRQTFFEIYDIRGTFKTRIADNSVKFKFNASLKYDEKDIAKSFNNNLDDSCLMVISEHGNTLRYKYSGELIKTYEGVLIDRKGVNILTLIQRNGRSLVKMYDIQTNKEIVTFVNGNPNFRIIGENLLCDDKYIYDTLKNKLKIAQNKCQYVNGLTFLSGDHIETKIWNTSEQNLQKFSFGNDIDTGSVTQIIVLTSGLVKDTVIFNNTYFYPNFSNTGKYIFSWSDTDNRLDIWSDSGFLIKSFQLISPDYYFAINKQTTFSQNDKFLAIYSLDSITPKINVYEAPLFNQKFSIDVSINSAVGFSTNEDTICIYDGQKIRYYDQNFKQLNIISISKIRGTNQFRTLLPELKFPYLLGARSYISNVANSLTDSILILYNLSKPDSQLFDLKKDLKLFSDLGDPFWNYCITINEYTRKLITWIGSKRLLKICNLNNLSEKTIKLTGEFVFELQLQDNLIIIPSAIYHTDIDYQLGRVIETIDRMLFEIFDLNKNQTINQFTINIWHGVEYLKPGFILADSKIYDLSFNELIQLVPTLINPKVSPDGNTMVCFDYLTKRLVTIPLSTKGIITKVRDEEIFGKIRNFTEKEKIKYNIVK